MAAKKKAKKKVSKKKVSKKKAVTKVKSKTPVKVDAKLSRKVSKFILMKTNITAASKQLDAMKSEAHELEDELMTTLKKINQLGITVKSGSIKIKEKDVFNAKDWKKINAHCVKTKNFDVYQRRLSSTYLGDMYKDTGKTIKGVEHFTRKSLSHSKAK